MDHPKPDFGGRSRWRWATLPLLSLACLVLLGWRLPEEPIFVDEAAFISQSYFWDLLISGRVNDPLWLEYPAYDLPPLPKYLVGAALQTRGIARVNRQWAIAWYSNLHEQRFLSRRILLTARLPSLILGVVGCVGAFLLCRTAGSDRLGGIAALLIALNPLYSLHAMRAMADVPAEALVLLTCALGLVAWTRLLDRPMPYQQTIGYGVGVGILGGLAVLAKLNGGLGLMILAAWTVLGLGVSKFERRIVVGFALYLSTAGLAALMTFVLINPFVWSRPETMGSIPLANPVKNRESPVSRLEKIVTHRFEVPAGQQKLFPHNALITPAQKLAALGVQGFGRFGPFGPRHSDSTRRYDWPQDWGALIWISVVVSGALILLKRGRQQALRSQPPTAWALVAMAFISAGTVGWFLPLAWDRFFLPIQSSMAILGAACLDSGIRVVANLRVPR